MKKARIAAVVSATVLAAGLGAVTTAAASATAAAPGAEDHLTAVSSPLISQDAQGYEGKWAVTGSTLEESFERNGVVVSTGSTSLRTGLAVDDVTSFGYVAGFGDPATGTNYAQLSGQAGTGVSAVRVISASGVTTGADLADGVWGTVWLAGDSADEYGPAMIEYDTAKGTTTVSTDDVDVIAAEQLASQ